MKTTELEPVFDQLGNWARFNGWSWFVFTEKTPKEIYNVLVSQIANDDSVLILRADPSNPQGWAPKWLWEWLSARAKERSTF